MRSSGRKIAASPKCGPEPALAKAGGRACDRGHQAGVRLCQGALSRAQEKHSSPARDLRAGQSVHGAPASPALPTGVVCPKPWSATPCRPQYGAKTTQLPRSVASAEIEMPPIHAPAPYSDGVSRRFRRVSWRQRWQSFTLTLDKRSDKPASTGQLRKDYHEALCWAGCLGQGDSDLHCR